MYHIYSALFFLKPSRTTAPHCRRVATKRSLGNTAAFCRHPRTILYVLLPNIGVIHTINWRYTRNIHWVLRLLHLKSEFMGIHGKLSVYIKQEMSACLIADKAEIITLRALKFMSIVEANTGKCTSQTFKFQSRYIFLLNITG